MKYLFLEVPLSQLFLASYHFTIYYIFTKLSSGIAHNVTGIRRFVSPYKGLRSKSQGWQTVGGGWRGSELSDRPSQPEPRAAVKRRSVYRLLSAGFIVPIGIIPFVFSFMLQTIFIKLIFYLN